MGHIRRSATFGAVRTTMLLPQGPNVGMTDGALRSPVR